ncbi:MAG: DUF3768 domain-containing protein [Rhizobiales bacterium]|nr:DUF3768 domain-containing protein [Hyphomicrobiales bacterium]
MNKKRKNTASDIEACNPVTLAEAARATVIACLNDTFRTTFTGGQVMLTQGILALGGEAQRQVLEKVRAFEAFCTDNDPYGEHDFGSFEHGNERIGWKIDYYDPSLTYGSDNPADPTVTRRVLTIMLMSEW